MRSTIWHRCSALFIIVIFLGGCVYSPSTLAPEYQYQTMSKLFEIPVATSFLWTAMRSPTTGNSAGTPRPTATISPTAPNCTNQAQFVSETLPDLTNILPGTALLKTWTLKNIGTCTWGKGYFLVFDHGDQMNAPASIPFTASVPPNAIYTFVVNLVAPTIEGQYQGFWMIQTPQLVRFGIEADGKTPIWVKIAVSTTPGCSDRDGRPIENGVPVQAVHAFSLPALDAKLSDWEEPLSFSVSTVVAGGTENKARFSLRWDSSYLYLAALISDNTFVQETSGGSNLFKGDSLEILLDTDLKGDYCNTLMNGDDYQLGISPGFLPDPPLQSPSVYLWYPLGKKGVQNAGISARLTSSPDPKGWILEARIPWNIFGVMPHGGEVFGFTLSVSDNDHPGTAQQDGMISTSPRRTSATNPVLWGTLQIIPDSGT